MLLDIDISLVIMGISVMLLLFSAMFISFIITQRKKLHHQEELRTLQQSQQNQLIEAAIRSEELVRHSISEELHDEVGAILSSAKLHLQGMKKESLAAGDIALYEKGQGLLDDGIQQVRNISHNLHSNILKELGLNEAINHFINKLCQGTMMNIRLELDERYAGKNPDSDMSIYRIVQELVSNIMKHAAPKEICIHSAFEDDIFCLMIQHDGAGLTQEQFEKLRYNRDGLGLKNIQNRIILLKGSIEFASQGKESSVKIFVPAKYNNA